MLHHGGNKARLGGLLWEKDTDREDLEKRSRK